MHTSRNRRQFPSHRFSAAERRLLFAEVSTPEPVGSAGEHIDKMAQDVENGTRVPLEAHFRRAGLQPEAVTKAVNAQLKVQAQQYVQNTLAGEIQRNPAQAQEYVHTCNAIFARLAATRNWPSLRVSFHGAVNGIPQLSVVEQAATAPGSNPYELQQSNAAGREILMRQFNAVPNIEGVDPQQPRWYEITEGDKKLCMKGTPQGYKYQVMDASAQPGDTWIDCSTDIAPGTGSREQVSRFNTVRQSMSRLGGSDGKQRAEVLGHAREQNEKWQVMSVLLINKYNGQPQPNRLNPTSYRVTVGSTQVDFAMRNGRPEWKSVVDAAANWEPVNDNGYDLTGLTGAELANKTKFNEIGTDIWRVMGNPEGRRALLTEAQNLHLGKEAGLRLLQLKNNAKVKVDDATSRTFYMVEKTGFQLVSEYRDGKWMTALRASNDETLPATEGTAVSSLRERASFTGLPANGAPFPPLGNMTDAFRTELTALNSGLMRDITRLNGSGADFNNAVNEIRTIDRDQAVGRMLLTRRAGARAHPDAMHPQYFFVQGKGPEEADRNQHICFAMRGDGRGGTKWMYAITTGNAEPASNAWRGTDQPLPTTVTLRNHPQFTSALNLVKPIGTAEGGNQALLQAQLDFRSFQEGGTRLMRQHGYSPKPNMQEPTHFELAPGPEVKFCIAHLNGEWKYQVVRGNGQPQEARWNARPPRADMTDFIGQDGLNAEPRKNFLAALNSLPRSGSPAAAPVVAAVPGGAPEKIAQTMEGLLARVITGPANVARVMAQVRLLGPDTQERTRELFARLPAPDFSVVLQDVSRTMGGPVSGDHFLRAVGMVEACGNRDINPIALAYLRAPTPANLQALQKMPNIEEYVRTSLIRLSAPAKAALVRIVESLVKSAR